MAIIEVKVPDIGDFKDVAVIELLVKPGDTIKVEQSLVTVESDKASMEIPSSAAGVVKELKVKLGDTVNQGTLLLLLEGEGAAVAATTAAPTPAAAPAAVAAAPAAPVPAPASYAGGADIECDMLVLGAGPGGYSAAFRAADLGLKTVLVERFPTLGGVLDASAPNGGDGGSIETSAAHVYVGSDAHITTAAANGKYGIDAGKTNPLYA